MKTENMKKSWIFILPFLSLLFNALSAKSGEESLAPALYVFGDSLADSGNNNGLPTQAKANYRPYGIDFDGDMGRFTNGNTLADFIAMFLRLPFAPPYLGLSNADRSKIITGLNYASGSAGILPETGSRLGKCIWLGEQIDFFRRTVEIDLPRHFKGSKALLEHLSKSIFIVLVGSNDYINNYLQPDYYNTSQYSSQGFARILVDQLSQHLKRLYKLGARKIVVFELGIIGCMPSITNAADVSTNCKEEVNQLVKDYNQQLSFLLKKLQFLLEESIFIEGQVFASGYYVYHNPSKFGFKYTNIPCCVVSDHNGTKSCVPDQPPCQDRDQHLFWDAFHPTQAVNAMVGIGCFNQSTLVCTPMNIEQLAQV